MKKPETRKARAARLAKRNARQQAYRARPGRAEAEALASRKSYLRRTLGLVTPACYPSSRCSICAKARATLNRPYRPRAA
jgi:hypothetical protein